MSAAIDALIARVAELEREVGEIREVKLRREDVREHTRRTRLASMAAIVDRDDRNVAIGALQLAERRELFALAPHAVDVVLAAPNPTTRAAWIDEMPAHMRDLVRVELVEVPARVRLTADRGWTWSPGRMPITDATYRELLAAGLERYVETEHSKAYYLGLPFKYGDDAHNLTCDQLALIHKVDDGALAFQIERGTVIVSRLSDAQAREWLLRTWRDQPLDQRRPLPARRVG